MKQEQEVQTKLEWLKNAIDREENQQEAVQIRLWAQINCLLWVQGKASSL